MREDPEYSDSVQEAHSTLTRISDALGIPVAAFHGCGADADVREQLQRMREAQVLTLVRSYLHDVDREARQRFVAAVQASAEAQ